MTRDDKTQKSEDTDFAAMAEEEHPGIIADFWDFIVHNKRWWLTPIIVVLLLVGILLVLGSGGSAAAPFIYTLF